MKPFAASEIKRRGKVWPRWEIIAFPPLLNIIIVVSLMIFPAEAADNSRPQIAAEVNQARITDVDVREEVRSYLRKIGHRELSPARMAAVEKDALKKLIEEELLYQEGLRLQRGGTAESEWVVTEKEVEAGVLRIRNRFPSQQSFEASLAETGLTVDAVRKGVERSRLIQKTWAFFSLMSQKERTERLKEITESAAIQIHPRHALMNEERLEITGRR